MGLYTFFEEKGSGGCRLGVIGLGGRGGGRTVRVGSSDVLLR